MNRIFKPANFSALLLLLALGISHHPALMAQDQRPTDSSVAVSPAAPVEKGNLLDVKLTAIDGRKLDLSVHKGKVIVVVNTASECGFTSQYKQLEQIYQKHHAQGLVVLGFPCNQFGEQEPGENEEIAEFCKNKYGITFDLFAKSNVNGAQQNDLYKALCAHQLEPKGKGEVNWNFEKFIIGRGGRPVSRFASRVSPTDSEFTTILKQELAKEVPADVAVPATAPEN